MPHRAHNAPSVGAVPDDPETIELDVGQLAGGGGCVGRAPDGRVVFVRHAIPGERVKAKVTDSARSFLRADAVAILTPSADRVSPPCPHAGPGRCGGCDFQHIELGAQRRLKAARIEEQLAHFTGITHHVTVESVKGDTDGLEWRTRIRLAVDGEGRVGFHRHRSHDLEMVTHCPIACPEIEASDAFGARWVGAKEVEVAVAPDRRQCVIDIVTPPKVRPTLPQLSTGMVVNARVQRQPGDLHTTVGRHTFRVTAGVFWQVHVGAASALSTAVRAALGAKSGERVVDLYAGAGLFSVMLAQEVGHRGHVLAIERDRRACADAEHNGRELPQLHVQRASVTPRVLAQRAGRCRLGGARPCTRRGRAGRDGRSRRPPDFAATGGLRLVRSRLVRSRRPGAARRGYSLAALRAFDIFPMTEHVELVATFDAPGH